MRLTQALGLSRLRTRDQSRHTLASAVTTNFCTRKSAT